MPHSISQSSDATPRQSLADVCGKPVKAELRAQVGASRMREVAADAIKRSTSQKAAATDIGIHEARLSHKLKDGTLTIKEMEVLGATFGAEFGKGLLERFGGEVKSERERARERLPEIIRELLVATA